MEHEIMRPVTRLATLLFATVALAGCEDKADFSNLLVPVTPVIGIGGTFNLQTLDGLALPQTIDLGTGPVSLTASILTLVTTNSTSGSFTALFISTPVGATTPVDTTTLTGSYTLSGTALTLTSGTTTITGSWPGGNSLSLTVDNHTLVYIRP
jgi:hypothetical protein